MPMIIIDEGPGSAASPPMNGTVTATSIAEIEHFKTPPGIAKLAQFLFGIVTLCLGPPIWLRIVGWIGLWGTFTWMSIYFFTMNKRFVVNPPWIVLEFYFTAGAFVYYAVMTFFTFVPFLYVVDAIFGAFTTAAYGVGAWFLYIEWQAWRANPINTIPK